MIQKLQAPILAQLTGDSIKHILCFFELGHVKSE